MSAAARALRRARPHVRANGSIWPGALLHGIVQGAIKLLVDDDAAFQTLAIAWVALGIAAPWLFFLLRPPN